MTEFEGQVLADLSVLKSQMQEVLGIGQPGRLHALEHKVDLHGQTVQRLKGLTGGFGGLITALQVLLAYWGRQHK